MYLPVNFDRYWACDIEGDNLPSNVVWCLCVQNLGTSEELTFTKYSDIKTFFSTRPDDYFVFHNGLGYDAPTLNRLVGTNLSTRNVVDTMLLSMYYSPSLKGGHSLEEWGNRLNFHKIDFNDYSKLTNEMLIYCMQDARLCGRIFKALVKRMLAVGFSEAGCKLEHQAWALIQRQKLNGVHFDIEGAHVLYAELRQIEQGIQERVHEVWPPVLQRLGTYQRPYRKDGSESQLLQRHRQQYESVCINDDGTYSVFGRVPFNIGSPNQRVEKLLELGWKPSPDERTPTGQPKPTAKGKLVPSLERFVVESGLEGPRLIASWIEINARANMVNTWIEAYNPSTGCIHGSLWLANTLRFRHSDPNTANIPAVRTDKDGHPLYKMDGVYTFEARNLWTTRDATKRKLVGVDAKGIQLRILAHYLNNKEFIDAVLSGDPHSYNQEIGGFATRAIAKTFLYSYLLGAGDAKVGSIIGGTTKAGREVKARFTNNFPGLGHLLDDLERQVERTNRIRLCDGTPLLVEHPHTRLGYLLQGDESRIMKTAAVIIHTEVAKRGLDVLKVLDVHDEFQFDVANDNIEEFIEVCDYAFKTAGERFKYRIPIACDAKVGVSWARTH